MAVMHEGDRAVVVAHTSHALVRPIAGRHLRADQVPDTVCNVREVCRTIRSHGGYWDTHTQSWTINFYSQGLCEGQSREGRECDARTGGGETHKKEKKE